MNPPLKWAGGKRNLIPILKKDLPKFDTYYEPFVGGGALFFSMGSTKRSYISDKNLDLIHFYRELRDYPTRFYRATRRLWRTHSEDQFYYIRDAFNNTQSQSKKAVYLYYLNKHCFNGLYRTNKKGGFNVPIGKTNPPIPSGQDVANWSTHLSKTKISAKCYTRINPTYNDLVYLDPPYYGLFNNYTKDGFNKEDHEKLSQVYKEWANQGVHIMISNADHPHIRELYQDFNITEVVGNRSISREATQRKGVIELLIRTF